MTTTLNGGILYATATAVAIARGVRVTLDSNGLISAAGAGVLGIGVTAQEIEASGRGAVHLWNKEGSLEGVGASGITFAPGDTIYTAAAGEFTNVASASNIPVGIGRTTTASTGLVSFFAPNFPNVSGTAASITVDAANGTGSSVITGQVKNAAGANLTGTFVFRVWFSTAALGAPNDFGTLTATNANTVILKEDTDDALVHGVRTHTDGTYSLTMTGAAATIHVNVEINGLVATDSAVIS